MSDTYDPTNDIAAAMHRQDATNTLSAVSTVPPAAAATALKAAPASGIPPNAGMFDPASAAAALKKQDDARALRNPAVARWVAGANPAHVAAAQDALPSFASIASSLDQLVNGPAQGLWNEAKAGMATSPPKSIREFLQNAVSGLATTAKLAQGGAALALEGPFQISQQQAANEWLRGVVGDKTFAGIQKTIGEASAAIMPEAGGALAAGGEIGLNPGVGEFGSAREAAMSVRGQEPEPGFEWKVQSTNTGYKPIQTPTGASPNAAMPVEGADPAADLFRKAKADLDADAVAKTQEAVAESPVLARSPETVRDFVERSAPGEMVHLSPTQIVKMLEEGKLSPEDFLKLAPTPQAILAFGDAHQTGSSYAIPLSDYIIASAGKPWAAELNQGTRFSEDGVSQMEAKDLPQPAEPREVAPPEIPNLADWSSAGAKLTGTHSGGVYADEEGQKWLVKGTSGAGDDAARSEVLAAQLAKLAGANVPETKLVNLGEAHGGGLGLASKFIEGLKPADVKNPEHRAGIQKELAAHAWISNRDVIGTGDYPNLFETPEGRMLSIDLGGALRYRATLQPKLDFGENPVEWESLRNPKFSVPHSWFGEMTPEQLDASAATLKGATDEKIEDAVRASGVNDPDGLIKTLIARRNAILGEVWTPAPIEADAELSGPENEALKLQEPAIMAAAKEATQHLYLNGLFADGKALGMSEADLAAWSKKVQAAQQAIYEKLIARAKAQIKKFRTPTWKRAYEEHYVEVSSEYLTRPVVRARTQLTQSVTETVDLTKDNALVKDGKPITFYRITNHSDTGDGEVPVDLFVNPRPVASPHPYWVATAQHAQWNKGISFGENPEYAQRSAQHGTGDINDPYYEQPTDLSGKPLRPVLWVVHVKSNRVGDFRNPADVETALDWYKKRKPQASYESDADFAWRVKEQRSNLARGSYALWEVQPMLQEVGWNAVRMVETPEMRTQPNLFVADPGIVHWKYDQGSVPVKMRLDIAHRDHYPADLLADLPKGIWAKDGAHPDTFAEQLGFESGEQMLRAMQDMEQMRGDTPFKTWLERQVKYETALRAKDELGWDLSPQGLLDLARESVDAPQVEDLLIDSLKGLREQLIRAGMPPELVQFSKEDLQNRALDLFGRMPLKDATNIQSFERAIRSNGRAVEKGLLHQKDGGLIEAFKARQSQILNYYQLAEAHRVVAEFKKFNDRLRTWSKNEIAKTIDPDFVNQMHAILASVGVPIEHDFTHLAGKLAETPYADFKEFWNNAGMDLSDDPLPRNEHGNVVRGVEKMPVRDFRDFFNTLMQLAHMGRIISVGTMMSEKASLQALVAEARGNLGRRPPNITKIEREHPTVPQQMSAWLRDVDSWLLKMEQMFIDLDYRDPHGPFNRAVVLPLESRKAWVDDAHREIAAHFHDLQGKLGKDFPAWLKTRIDLSTEFPELVDRNGDPYFGTNGDILGAALHTGSGSNWRVLIDSWPKPVPRETWERLFTARMTKDAWTYAQGMWDIFAKFKPELYAMYERINGIPMTEVRPQLFTNLHGEFAGGYYPVTRSALGLPKNYVNPDRFMGQDQYWRASPANPHAKERTGSRAPLELSLSHGRWRLEQLIHDIGYREVLQQVDRFLGDDSLKAAIVKKYGPEYYGRMQDLIRKAAGAAGFNSDQSESILRLIEGANRNAILDLVGYSTQTVAKHFLSALGDTVATVGKGPTLAAYRHMFTNWDDFWNFVLTNSPEVRNRVMNVTETARESYLRIIEQRGWMSSFQRGAFDWVAASDQISAAPAWWAEYWKHVIDPEISHDRAVQLADQAVRQAHGASSMIDSAPFLRLGRERSIPAAVYKSGTQLMNFFSHKWNRAREIPQDLFGLGGYKRNIPRGINNLIFLIGVAAVVEEKLREWYGAQVGSALDTLLHIPVSGLPWVNDAISGLEGRENSDSSMFLEAPAAAGKVVEDIGKAATGHPVKYPIEDAANAIGFLQGLPGKQFGNSAQFLFDETTGREQNVHNVGDFLHGLLTGPQGLVPPAERGKAAARRGLAGGLHRGV